MKPPAEKGRKEEKEKKKDKGRGRSKEKDRSRKRRRRKSSASSSKGGREKKKISLRGEAKKELKAVFGGVGETHHPAAAQEQGARTAARRAWSCLRRIRRSAGWGAPRRAL